VEHAGNGAVVDGLVRIDRLGVILFHEVVNLRELAKAVTDIIVRAAAGVRAAGALAEADTEETANYDYEEDEEKRAT